MASSKECPLIFFVNGKKITIENPDPGMTLIIYLRQHLLLTGTKLSCGMGACGVCTVMLSRIDRKTKKIRHYAVNSCITPVCSLHGLAVTTVEGIGSTRSQLHPVQERLVKSFGIQCGFCTPGMVMSMYALLRNNPKPSRREVESVLKGNLCRCTGYRPILEGFSSFTDTSQCPMGEKCCKNVSTEKEGISTPSLYDSTTFKEYDASQELIFPSELQLSEIFTESVKFECGENVWYHPQTLAEVVSIKTENPRAVIVAGANKAVFQMKKTPREAGAIFVNISHLSELGNVNRDEDHISIGSNLTIAQVQDILSEVCRTESEVKTRAMSAILEMCQWLAGQQLKNTATIGGHVMSSGAGCDLLPLLAAFGCSATILSPDGERKVLLNEDFYPNSGETILKSNELLTSIHIPYSEKDVFCVGFKQGPRRDMALSNLTAGMMVQVENNQVKQASVYFSSLQRTVTKAAQTEQAMRTRTWVGLPHDEVRRGLTDDIRANAAPGDKTASLKSALAHGFYIKFYQTVSSMLDGKQYAEPERPLSGGIQIIEDVAVGQDPVDTVGRPVAHMWAEQQATGEAVYIDDITPAKDELYLCPVLSSVAHARLVKVDPSDALTLPGVVDYIDRSDVPGPNHRQVITERDEFVFAEDEVLYDGQMIGAVLAESPQLARAGANQVKVEYEKLPQIITIQDSIKCDSFYECDDLQWTSGEPEAELKQADVIVEGEFETSGQEHFYMETQTVRVVPQRENEEYVIYSAAQFQQALQVAVAQTLCVPFNKVTIKTKRVGGGFGGKEFVNQLVVLPCAVAAHKWNRPVRCVLERSDDMRLTGGRHPYLVKYKAGVSKEGRVNALTLDMYTNAGYTLNISEGLMWQSIYFADNCYSVAHRRHSGFVCKTNIHSNHALRGAGQPQAVMAAEYVMYQAAKQLELPRHKIQEANFYKSGDFTHYKQEMKNCNIDRCFSEVKKLAGYEERIKDIAKFNSDNTWRKRGIDIMPIKFAPLFPLPHSNQATAYIMIYVDGSVLLAHGGVEIGQGVHTKMIQVASRALGIPVGKILIQETSTATIANAAGTGGSSASDLNGMAIVNACKILNERLGPVKEAAPDASWEQWVTTAYEKCISLSACGYYNTPGLDFDRAKGGGNRVPYYCFGAGCCEVEIDCLTGAHTVTRVDIVMDVGKSLNPGIDVGQIEGGFMMGYGMFALEEIAHDEEGKLVTNNPYTYRIPAVTNIPLQFNVALLKDAPNPRAVYSSKAIGEPALLLGSTVYFAIREAVEAFRKDAGLGGNFALGIPTTVEKVRLACEEGVQKLCQKL